MPDSAPSPTALVRAVGISFAPAGAPVFAGLSFDIQPGLTLVRGGDGRGKSSLLRLIAGEIEPTAGTFRRHAASLFHASTADPSLDGRPVGDWLAGQQACYASWDPALQARLVDGFGLAEHAHKSLGQLSAGSRRKVGLVAAAASGAQLTLLDMPFAALDAPSRRLLSGLLREAATRSDRAWVVADGQWPEGFEGGPVACRIDLGD